MISAVILTKNEESNIADCLKTLGFCDEIIVVDDNSEDTTVEIAKKAKEKVFTHSLENDFSKQRNFGLEKSSGDWVFFIDADERVSDGLAYEITQRLRDPERLHVGYVMQRVDYIWGKKLKHGEVGNVRLLRLVQKKAGKWEGDVHEKLRVHGSLGTLKNPLLHYPHPTVSEFLQDINLYTSLRAKQLYKQGVKANFWSVVIYPKAKFFVNYFLKMGFLDGVAGLVIALMMSFHSFLVRGKLWLLWQKNK